MLRNRTRVIDCRRHNSFIYFRGFVHRRRCSFKKFKIGHHGVLIGGGRLGVHRVYGSGHGDLTLTTQGHTGLGTRSILGPRFTLFGRKFVMVCSFFIGTFTRARELVFVVYGHRVFGSYWVQTNTHLQVLGGATSCFYSFRFKSIYSVLTIGGGISTIQLVKTTSGVRRDYFTTTI